MVVDDEVGVRDILTIFFSSDGHQTTSFKSAEEALRALGDEKWDLIMTDCFMPGMDGFEFVRHVRQQSPVITIMMMSSLGSLLLEDYCRKAGINREVDGYVHKPFDFDKLSEISSMARRRLIEAR